MKQYNTMENRRRFIRKATTLSCQIESHFHSRQETVDISRGGIRIYSDQYLAVDEHLSVQFFVPGNETVTSTATVAWVREIASKKASQIKYEIGLKFIAISADNLEILLNLDTQSVPSLDRNNRFHCLSISELVQQALTTGFLTIEAENHLRQLLRTKYNSDDLCAFFTLQQATLDGYVSQESRQKKSSSHCTLS